MWLLVAVIIIFIVAVVIANNKHNEMVESGVIAHRDTDFMQRAEEFRVTNVSDADVKNAVAKLFLSQISVSYQALSNGTIRFSGQGWNATLSRQSKVGDPSALYRFQFNNFVTRYSAPQGGLSANKLLTLIEKMFVSLDPKTQARFVQVNYNTTRI